MKTLTTITILTSQLFIVGSQSALAQADQATDINDPVQYQTAYEHIKSKPTYSMQNQMPIKAIFIEEQFQKKLKAKKEILMHR